MHDECICSSTGYCEYLGQHVGPSLLKACQGWTPELRNKMRSQNNVGDTNYSPSPDEKIMTKLREVGFNCYITIEMLANICKHNLIRKLPAHDIGGVIGIPRSGMIVASILAAFLNTPIYCFDENGFFPLGGASALGGRRMAHFNKEEAGKKILVVDDWVWRGKEMDRAKQILLSKHPTQEFIFAGIFVEEHSQDFVDFYAEILTDTYPYCEWSFFTDSSTGSKILDLDGLMCPDASLSALKDEDSYRNFIANVPCFAENLPKRVPCEAILTGRSEIYRDVTEAWLKKHKALYKKLIMYPKDKPMPKGYDFSDYKAEFYASSSADILVESDCLQAQLIYNKTHRPTMCLPAGRIFNDGQLK